MAPPSDFVEAKLVTGGPRQFPNGQIVQPGETVVLPRAEAQASDNYEITGTATQEEHFASTGMIRPAPAEETQAEVDVTPDKPHPDYDNFSADKVIETIGRIEDNENATALDQLGQILEYERARKDRTTVTKAAEDRITAILEGQSQGGDS